MGDVEFPTADHGRADLVLSVLFSLDAIIITEKLRNIKTKVAALDDVVGDLDTNLGGRIRSAVLAAACRFTLKLEGVVR